MEAIKEIYKCPLCSHGTLDPENHSCHKQFVLQLNNLKDNKPVLLEWEEYKDAHNCNRKKTCENCLVCGMFCSLQNKPFCSKACHEDYLNGGDK